VTDGRTHWEGCYKEYGHKDCAVAQIERLTAAVEHNLKCVHSRDERIEELQARVEELEGVLNDPLELRLYINKKLEDEAATEQEKDDE
jgi:hypothetical protein